MATHVGYNGVKLAAGQVLPAANDPSMNGKPCYFVTCRYSNMYVSTYSYESCDVAEQAAD